MKKKETKKKEEKDVKNGNGILILTVSFVLYLPDAFIDFITSLLRL